MRNLWFTNQSQRFVALTLLLLFSTISSVWAQCNYAEGQFLFTTSWGESVYAHYYNGTLYAAYKDGSNFRPQHWLAAAISGTGFDPNKVSCFAENDPHTTSTPASTTSPAGANYAGSFDGADCNQIFGWVLNRNTPKQSIGFDVYINGSLAASNMPANGSRQDVANAYGISGYSNFGFGWSIPSQYKNGTALTISVKYAGTNTDIPGSPKTTAACQGTGNPPSTNPTNPPEGANYAGNFDGADCNQVSGWVLDRNTPKQSMSCDVYINGQLAAHNLMATGSRQDVANAYGISGYSNFGFSWSIPNQYKSGTALTISIKYAGTNTDIPGSPKTTMVCQGTGNPPTNPTTPSNSKPQAGNNLAGNMDWADCNGISGWVLNKNTPNQSTKVDVYINGHLAASNVLAIVSRQDVANVFGISGFNAFGFHYVFPGKYKTGVPLTIGVRYAGTRTHIPGSPKTTQICPSSGLGGFPSCSYQTAGRIGYVDPESTPKGRSGISSLQLRASRSGQPGSITSKLVPVRQGSELTVTALAYAPTVTKRNLAPQLASAVAGGIVAGITLANQPTGSPDQPHSISGQTIPMLGLSTALAIPLARSLMAERLPKAGMELAFYDKRGNFVHRQSMRISKAAGQDWELLSLKGDALQDGFVALRLENASKSPVWFDQVSLELTSRRPTESVGSGHFEPRPSSSSNGFARSVVPGDMTIAGTENCAGVGGGGGGSPTPSDDNTLPDVTVTASHWEDIAPESTGFDDWNLDTPTTDFSWEPESPISQADNNGDSGAQQAEDPFHLNNCEIAYVATHPYVYEPLSKNRSLVEDWLNTHEGYEDANSDGDCPHNAIKHALYQALNVCRVGLPDTEAMANFHEICEGVRWGGSPASIAMDKFNNNVGMSLPDKYGCNFDNLLNAVLYMFINGKLHKIDGTPTP